MIKTVLFDLDDTIFDFNMSEKIAIIKTFESFGYDVTDEMILKYSQYNISQWKRLELGEISREEVKVNRFKLLFDDLGLDLSPKKTTLVYEENLAKGQQSAEQVCNDWFASSSHNENIVKRSHRTVGISVFCQKLAEDDYVNNFSQLFSTAK